MLSHLKGDNWQTRLRAYVMRGIAFQELSRREFQPLLETQDIIRGQELIQISATAIETRDARVTRKLESVIEGKLLEIFHQARTWCRFAIKVGEIRP
jgi:hypothetical protein